MLPNDEPPDGGTIRLYIPTPPASFQASGRAKQALRNAIQLVLADAAFVLIDDVRVSLDWLINSEERYESDASADVDNVIKPILDALCGPQGILVNDCQVQRCDALWRDRGEGDESIEITLEYDPDAWCPKKDLVFLRFGRGLAFPLNTQPRELVVRTAEHVINMVDNRDSYDTAFGKRLGRYQQPIQRVFHVSRVQGFPVLTLEQVRQMYSNGE